VFGQRMAGNPQVMGPDGGASVLQPSELLGIVVADRGAIGIPHRHLSGQRVESAQDLRFARAALGPLEQLGPGDEGHAQARILRQGIHPLSDGGRLVPDQVDQGAGIQQVNHSASRS
jgi:hypothetical protein